MESAHFRRKYSFTLDRRSSTSCSLRSTSSLHPRLRCPRSPRQVKFNEAFNSVFEYSIRSERLTFEESYLTPPTSTSFECSLCMEVASDESQTRTFKVYIVPNGTIRILCPNCTPPSDQGWVFDGMVTTELFIPSEALQLILSYLGERDARRTSLVSRQWHQQYWAVVTLRDDQMFEEKLSSPRLCQTCILFIYLSNETDKTKITKLCNTLSKIDMLEQLTVSGLTDDQEISALANGLRGSRFLNMLDVAGCSFFHKGMYELLTVLEDTVVMEVELRVPYRCVIDSNGSGSKEEAQDALSRMVLATHIKVILV